MNDYTRIKTRAMSMPVVEAKMYMYMLLETAGRISYHFYCDVMDLLDKKEKAITKLVEGGQD